MHNLEDIFVIVISTILYSSREIRNISNEEVKTNVSSVLSYHRRLIGISFNIP
jgi:hypothetical protein